MLLMLLLTTSTGTGTVATTPAVVAASRNAWTHHVRLGRCRRNEDVVYCHHLHHPHHCHHAGSLLLLLLLRPWKRDLRSSKVKSFDNDWKLINFDPTMLNND